MIEEIATICLAKNASLNRPRSRVERSGDLGLTFQCPPQKGFRGKITAVSRALFAVSRSFCFGMPRARERSSRSVA